MHKTPQVLHGTPQLGIRLHSVETHEVQQGQYAPPHQRSTWELTYVRSGYVERTIGGDTYGCEPGMLLLSPPAVIHAERARTTYASISMQIAAPLTHPWPRLHRDNEDGILGNVCLTIAREWRAQASYRTEMLAALLTQLDILLCRAQQHTHPSKAECLVHEVERILEERLATTPTIKDIANELSISPSHLRDQFTRIHGCGPLAYLQRVRVQHALAMLRTSDLTLDAVATLCGYDSASHLSRYVKRATGKSPGVFRTG